MAIVVLDASAIIAFLDSEDAHHPSAVEVFSELKDDELRVPATAYAEVLVGPYRRSRRAVERIESFIEDLAIAVEPIGTEIARLAARLRARHEGLRLPDALVLATAEAVAADAVVTADRSWRRITRRVRLVGGS